ncbi:unnamed protein product [Caenorhabditis bovis]|uniref:T20D4.11-like domain-containing protein n=1 Tax=Caenorhabditis bovis TaxID=2654633 RepID=A0A8S1EBD7_9PELO|nr:unnamed protein product [Caenorhabditis bovis]
MPRRLLLLLFIGLVASEARDVARYLKQCGFVTSLKTTKCVFVSRQRAADIRRGFQKNVAVQKQLKNLAKMATKNVTKVKEACIEAVECIEELKCPPASDDFRDVTEFCWRAKFARGSYANMDCVKLTGKRYD